MASPALIHMALFYHTRPPGEVYREGNVNGGNFSCQFHQELGATGLIKFDAERGVWVGNDAALSVYADALMSVPLPVEQWSIPTPPEQKG